MLTILMMSAKLATPGLLKIKILRSKGYDIIIPDYDVTNKILSRDSNCIVYMVMWPKLSNSSISMREVIITSILQGFHQKNYFFLRGGLGSSFNNLGLPLGMTLKFYTSVAKGLKLKLRKFWGLSFTFEEFTGEKTGKGASFALPTLPEYG